ncbi:MAG: tetratricopeptide repeat protein [Candidatus Fermentibacteraceae bacterium]
MNPDRLPGIALAHLDQGGTVPLVFQGLFPLEAERLFDTVRRRRPGLLDIQLDHGIRAGLKRLFGSPGLPDTFHDSWAALTVSLGIRGRAEGMEAAAGLQRHRETISGFLLSGIPGDETPEALCCLLDSIARFIPAVLLVADLQNADEFTVGLVNLMQRKTRRSLVLPPLLGALSEGVPPFRARLVRISGEGSTNALSVPAGLLGLVKAAAVLGQLFDPREAAELSQCGEDPSALFSSGIWVTTKGGPARFVNGSTRSRVMNSLTPDESRELHTGAALIVLSRANGCPGALKLAGDLFLRSGDGVSAGAAYLEAAACSSGSTHPRAARLWNLVAAHCPGQFYRAHLNRSIHLFKGGFMEQALEAAVCAMPGFETQAKLLMLEILIHMGDAPRAKALAESLEDGRRSGIMSPGEEVELAILSLILHRRNAVPGQVRAESERLEGEGLSERQRTRLLLVEARAMARHGMLHEALKAAEAARAKSVAHGFTWLAESCSIFKVSCLRKAGMLEAAATGCEDLRRAASRSGNIEALCYALNTRGGIASSQGLNDEAARCYASVGRIAERAGNHRLATTAAANLGVARMIDGRYEEALETFMLAVRLASEVGDQLRLAATYGNMTRIFLDMNRPGNAEDCLETMLEIVSRSGPDQLIESALYLGARLQDLKGDCDAAMASLSEASEMADRAGRKRNACLYGLYRGLFLMHHGRYEEAATALDDAVRECEGLDQQPNADTARVCLAACRALIDRSAPDELLEHSAGSPWRSVRGTSGYWHWKMTGDPRSARTAMDSLAPQVGECNAYRAHEMLDELRAALGEYLS